MGKGTIGVLAALVTWAGGAMAAYAQPSVEIEAPTAVAENATSIEVKFNVTNGGSFFYWRVWEKVDGIQKHDSGNRQCSGVSVTYLISGVSSWGLVAGQTLETKVRVWNGSGVDLEYSYLTISEAITYQHAEPRPSRSVTGHEDALVWLDRKHVQVVG